METLPLSLPHGGDLLRALRLRRGWTQERTATVLSVSQTTIARWERGEAWPAQELLQSLCYAMRAQEAEISALTLGRFALPDSTFNMGKRHLGQSWRKILPQYADSFRTRCSMVWATSSI